MGTLTEKENLMSMFEEGVVRHKWNIWGGGLREKFNNKGGINYPWEGRLVIKKSLSGNSTHNLM